MNIIHARHKSVRPKKSNRKSKLRAVFSRKKWPKRRIAKYIGITLGLFLFVNLIIGIVYQNRLYPASGVDGKQLGNATYTKVKQEVKLNSVIYFKLPDSNTNAVTIPTKDMGASLNWDATLKQIDKEKPKLPIAGLYGRKNYSLVVDYDQNAFNQTADDIASRFTNLSTNWTVDTSTGEVKLVKGLEGQTVDKAELKKRMTFLSNGYVLVPTTKVQPKITETGLQAAVDQLNAKRQVSLSYVYNGQTKKTSASEITTWYNVSDTTVALDKTAVTKYISGLGKGWGITVQNSSQAVTDTMSALNNQKSLTFAVKAAPKATKSYTYCVQSRGNVGAEYMPGFKSKITSTLNDNRSWSLNGQVGFSEVSSGCNFTVWLSEANQMPTFGGVCDSTWSCRSGNNVVINYDRWRNASDAWNGSGGSLEDYRVMVINHETGHWLQFGHRYCGGAGQPAPVMQQQSISLQGCTFSPWPNQAEKDTLKARLGL